MVDLLHRNIQELTAERDQLKAAHQNLEVQFNSLHEDHKLFRDDHHCFEKSNHGIRRLIEWVASRMARGLKNVSLPFSTRDTAFSVEHLLHF